MRIHGARMPVRSRPRGSPRLSGWDKAGACKEGQECVFSGGLMS